MKKRKPPESTLDDLLEKDGTHASARALAIKRVTAWQEKETTTKKTDQDDNGKNDEDQYGNS